MANMGLDYEKPMNDAIREAVDLRAENSVLREALIELRRRAKLAQDNCFSLGEVNASEANVWGIVDQIVQTALGRVN